MRIDNAVRPAAAKAADAYYPTPASVPTSARISNTNVTLDAQISSSWSGGSDIGVLMDFRWLGRTPNVRVLDAKLYSDGNSQPLATTVSSPIQYSNYGTSGGASFGLRGPALDPRGSYTVVTWVSVNGSQAQLVRTPFRPPYGW